MLCVPSSQHRLLILTKVGWRWFQNINLSKFCSRDVHHTSSFVRSELTATWNTPRNLPQSPTLFRRVARYRTSIKQLTLALIQS